MFRRIAISPHHITKSYSFTLYLLRYVPKSCCTMTLLHDVPAARSYICPYNMPPPPIFADKSFFWHHQKKSALWQVMLALNRDFISTTKYIIHAL